MVVSPIDSRHWRNLSFGGDGSHACSAGDYSSFEIFKRFPFGAAEFVIWGCTGTVQVALVVSNIKDRYVLVGEYSPVVPPIIVHNVPVWIVTTPFSVGFILVAELDAIRWYFRRHRGSTTGSSSRWREALGGQRNAMRLGSRMLVFLRHNILLLSSFRADRKKYATLRWKLGDYWRREFLSIENTYNLSIISYSYRIESIWGTYKVLLDVLTCNGCLPRHGTTTSQRGLVVAVAIAVRKFWWIVLVSGFAVLPCVS